jgi:hypothetical protein
MLAVDKQPVESQKGEHLHNLRGWILNDDSGGSATFLQLLFQQVLFHAIFLNDQTLHGRSKAEEFLRVFGQDLVTGLLVR